MQQQVRHVRRGSYFFAIDAFVATIIIVATLLILYGKHEYTPSATQAFSAADGYLSYIETSPVGYLDDPIVREWIAHQDINDTKATILYQLALFNVTGRNLNATALANLTIRSVPPQIGVEVLINGNRSVVRGEATEAEAAVKIVGKRIVIIRTGAADVATPVVVEVRTWQ